MCTANKKGNKNLNFYRARSSTWLLLLSSLVRERNIYDEKKKNLKSKSNSLLTLQFTHIPSSICNRQFDRRYF